MKRDEDTSNISAIKFFKEYPVTGYSIKEYIFGRIVGNASYNADGRKITLNKLKESAEELTDNESWYNCETIDEIYDECIEYEKQFKSDYLKCMKELTKSKYIYRVIDAKQVKTDDIGYSWSNIKGFVYEFALNGGFKNPVLLTAIFEKELIDWPLTFAMIETVGHEMENEIRVKYPEKLIIKQQRFTTDDFYEQIDELLDKLSEYDGTKYTGYTGTISRKLEKNYGINFLDLRRFVAENGVDFNKFKKKYIIR